VLHPQFHILVRDSRDALRWWAVESTLGQHAKVLPDALTEPSDPEPRGQQGERIDV